MNLVTVLEKEHTLIIDDKIYRSLPRTYETARKLSETSCNFQFTILSNSYTAIQYSPSKPFPLLSQIRYDVIELPQMLDNIVGVAKIYSYTYGHELYGVCTETNFRQQGISKTLLSGIIKTFGDKLIWLGVEMENPYFNIATHLYTNAGFGNVDQSICYLPQSSPGGIPINVNTVGMTRHPVPTRSPQEAFKVAKTMQLRYFDQKHTCQIPFIIGENLIRKLKSYLSKDREYAGKIVPVGYARDRVVLGFDKSSETKGADPPDFHVMVPPATLFFHTHPDVCYKTYGCYLGWPSGQDMAVTFWRYVNEGSLMHFVVTNEGLYAITLSAQFMHALQTLRGKRSSVSDKIFRLISKYFTSLEKYRTSGEVAKVLPPQTDMVQYIKKYMISVNEYKYSTLLQDAKTVNINLPQDIEQHLDSTYLQLRRTGLTNQIMDFHLFEVTYTTWTPELTAIGGGFKGSYYSYSQTSTCNTVSDIIL